MNAMSYHKRYVVLMKFAGDYSMKLTIYWWFALVLPLLSTPVAAESFKNYVNARYGLSLAIPAELGMDASPANSDGQRFSDGKGFSIAAYGSNNVLDETLTAEMDTHKTYFDKITYKAKGSGWFVLSGYKDADILYIKVFVGSKSKNHLRIQYPAAKAEMYSAIVSTVSASFKPGKLSEYH